MRVAALFIPLIASGALASGVGAQEPPEPEAPAPEPPIHAYGEYLARDGGLWQSPNPAHVPGGDQPRTWLIEHEWAPDGQHLRSRILGRHDGGRDTVAWHFYTMWNPVEQRPVYFQIAWDGTLGIGFIEIVDEDSSVADMRLMQPTGEEQTVRHRFDRTGPDSYESTVQVQGPDGAWRTVSTGAWTRVRHGEPGGP